MTDKIRLWEVLHGGKQASCWQNCKYFKSACHVGNPLDKPTGLDKNNLPDHHFIYCNKWEPKK